MCGQKYQKQGLIHESVHILDYPNMYNKAYLSTYFLESVNVEKSAYTTVNFLCLIVLYVYLHHDHGLVVRHLNAEF